MIFVEGNYNPSLVNLVKPPVVQAKATAAAATVEQQPCRVGSRMRFQVKRRRRKWPLDGAVDFF